MTCAVNLPRFGRVVSHWLNEKPPPTAHYSDSSRQPIQELSISKFGVGGDPLRGINKRTIELSSRIVSGSFPSQSLWGFKMGILAKTADSMGRLSVPHHEITNTTWDAIIIGAGHNGLVCASYLARAGKKVLVLEARQVVGGAATLEEVLPGIRMSPCAYVVGLLHSKVITELGMKEAGFTWFPAEGGMFVPFEDGSSIQFWNDDARCEEEIRKFSPKEVAGWKAMSALKQRLRDKIRPEGDGDLWIGNPPTREQLEDRLKGDPEAKALMFDWSMNEMLENFFDDERMHLAYMGQGVIGTKASPFTKGTASIHFHHASGRMGGMPGTWGYVKGGMGMTSFLLADIARTNGVAIATETPVKQILPGEGVRLESGETVRAAVVVSNADPKTTLKLLGPAAEAGWKAKVDSIAMTGCTVKVNVALQELPNFKTRPGTNEPHHLAQVNTPLTKQEWKDSFAAQERGELGAKLWTELYFHTAYDKSVSRDDIHTMSVFAQYVPYQFAKGDWDSRREEVGDLALAALARHTTNIPEAVLHRVTMGPPDIEKKVGLHGGHIFQGEILPDNLWENRLGAKTPMPGVYLCGAGIHPGGSVIGINGRNAAQEVLRHDH